MAGDRHDCVGNCPSFAQGSARLDVQQVASYADVHLIDRRISQRLATLRRGPLECRHHPVTKGARVEDNTVRDIGERLEVGPLATGEQDASSGEVDGPAHAHGERTGVGKRNRYRITDRDPKRRGGLGTDQSLVRLLGPLHDFDRGVPLGVAGPEAEHSNRALRHLGATHERARGEICERQRLGELDARQSFDVVGQIGG